MAEAMDVLIKGGLVVDGEGGEPYVADVAIKDGLIAAIGQLGELAASRVVEAAGHIVTPGFVDIHTHYDGQITWDPLLSPSTQHGVTGHGRVCHFKVPTTIGTRSITSMILCIFGHVSTEVGT
jgi:N-acyl-D-aspartate/D-glutamate deacylase